MRESMNKSNIPATFKEVGFNESFHMGKSEKFSYYIDKDFDFWCELEGGEIIKCPSAYRIDAFTFTWSGCRYWYDEETKRHYYVNPFYDGETFYLYAYSFGELLELIRKFVEPSDEIEDVLDSSIEMKTYRNTITEIFKN